MRTSDRVRLRCGATGRDIGGGWGLFVCAQDNDLGVDRIAPDKEPWADSPVPTDAAVGIARMVRVALEIESAYPPPGTPICVEHMPIQYRDGKEPWCPTCGLTADGRKPTSLFG